MGYTVNMAHVVVESSSRAAFDLAMRLAFLNRDRATHCLVDTDAGCMILFWHEPEEHWHATKLFNPFTVDKATDYVWDWLGRELRNQQRPVTPEPSVGAFHLEAGGEFRFYWKKCHTFSPDDGSSYSIVTVWPTWNEVHQ
jgi:hypothetical protein